MKFIKFGLKPFSSKAKVMEYLKKVTPKAMSCSKREAAILAAACRDMELRGLNAMENTTVIQVESCQSCEKHS